MLSGIPNIAISHHILLCATCRRIPLTWMWCGILKYVRAIVRWPFVIFTSWIMLKLGVGQAWVLCSGTGMFVLHWVCSTSGCGFVRSCEDVAYKEDFSMLLDAFMVWQCLSMDRCLFSRFICLVTTILHFVSITEHVIVTLGFVCVGMSGGYLPGGIESNCLAMESGIVLVITLRLLVISKGWNGAVYFVILLLWFWNSILFSY